MCCSAKWKREVVPDHKFDFLNVQEFRSTAFMTRLRYAWLYVYVVIIVGVYCANIYTAVTMIVATEWTNSFYSKCGDQCVVKIPFDVGKWIFVGCIIFSFLLLAYDSFKARKVIASRDISYAFTNVMANNYYSLRSYPHFCFFGHIANSTKKMDDFAFFVFFAFKGWKDILLADAPRQVINAIFLFSFAKIQNFQTDDLSAYYDGNYVTLMLLCTMIFTVVIFAIGLIRLIAAAILYIPLLCYIQGNLKEYCCHKIDKRIAELIKRKQRQRIARNAAMEKRLAGRGGTGEGGEMMPHQPTLPNVSLDDDEDDIRKPFGHHAAPIDGSSAYERSVPTAGPSYGGKGGNEKSWVPELMPGAEDYHGYGPPPMPVYQNYRPPQRAPSYPLQSVPSLAYQGGHPQQQGSSSVGVSYDEYPPTNGQASGYPPRQQQAYYPHSTSQASLYQEPTKAYDHDGAMYANPPGDQQYAYGGGGSQQQQQSYPQQQLRDSLSSEGGGAHVYASDHDVTGMSGVSHLASPPSSNTRHSGGGESDASSKAADYSSDAGGSTVMDPSQGRALPSGLASDYKHRFRPT